MSFNTSGEALDCETKDDCDSSPLTEQSVMRRLALGARSRGSSFDKEQPARRAARAASPPPVGMLEQMSILSPPMSPTLNRSPTSVLAFSSSPKANSRRSGCSVAIEGNIGVGKSTFLKLLKGESFNRSIVDCPEPVSKWQNVGDGKYNLLQEFYDDTKGFAYTFQSYAFITRFIQHNQSVIDYPEDIRVLERTVFTDKEVFVSSLFDQGLLSELEVCLYNQWFEPVLKTLPNLVPDVFIYLRASPESCMSRLKARSRTEEAGIELSYLEIIHDKHEKWLVDATYPANASSGQISISGKRGEPLGKQNLPGTWLRVFGPDCEFSELVGRPILVVDCEKKASSVNLDAFRFNSSLEILQCCGVDL